MQRGCLDGILPLPEVELDARQTHLEHASARGTTVVEELAGAGSRSYAFVLDWHIRILLVVLWYAGYMLLFSTIDLIGITRSATWPTRLWLNAPPALIYLLYHPLLELVMAGNSPGKVRAGLRVVDRQGRPPGAGAILVRNAFRLIDALPMLYAVGLCSVLLTRQQVRLGDLVAGTVVVKRAAKREQDFDYLQRVEHSALDAETAALAIELIQRWPTMQREQRIRLAQSIMSRAGLTESEPKEKALLRALKRLVPHT